jgi:hypothetical protein
MHSSQFLFLAKNGMIKYSAIALLSDAIGGSRQQHKQEQNENEQER